MRSFRRDAVPAASIRRGGAAINASNLIALVGIDGAGKTTVIENLRADASFASVDFIHKVHRDNTQRLERVFPSEAIRPGAYWKGNFACAWRWAHALDFLRFYEEEFLPRHQDGKRVIADRWLECVTAFADAGTNIRGEIDALLAPCARAGLVIMLDVDPAEARRRIERRGDAKPDEDLGLLEAYRESYLNVLSESASEVLIVPSASLAETSARIASAIHSFWCQK